MSFMSTARERFQSEMSKLKGKPWKDKIWYIWEYYKFPIIGIAVGIFLIGSIASAMYGNRFDTALSCVIFNASADDDGTLLDTYFNRGFRDYAGLDENSVIAVDSSFSIHFEGNLSQFDYAALAKITAMSAAHDLDVMIGDPTVMAHYGSLGALTDLKELLPDDLYSLIQDRIYIAPDESGAEIPCGIRLNGTSFAKKTGLAIDDPIFAVTAGSTRTETGIALLRYLLGQ